MRRLGLIHRPAPATVVRFGAALRSPLPAPKPVVDHHSAVSGWDCLGNKHFGCCVPAGILHAAQIRMSNAMRSAWRPTTAQALELYRTWAGFDPARPETDIGTDPNVAFAACAHGLDLGFQVPDVAERVVLDPHTLDHLKLAIDWFGCICLSLNLPPAAEDARVWSMRELVGDRTPGGWGPHFIVSGRYDRDGFRVITWGEELVMTSDFLAAYVLAADALVSREDWFSARGVSPAGLDFDESKARAREMAEPVG